MFLTYISSNATFVFMNILLNGNCLVILPTLIQQGVLVDCVATDPPYKTTPMGCSGTLGGIVKTKSYMSGNGGLKYNVLKIEQYLPLLMKIMKPKAHGYLFCNDKNLDHFLVQIKAHGFSVFKTLVWVKNAPITNQYYMTDHEYIIFFRKGKAKRINDCGTRATFFDHIVRNRLHPNQKPVSLMETLIRNSTQKGEVVLDFAMGANSTGIACAKLERKFIGIEIDSAHFLSAQNRYKHFLETGIDNPHKEKKCEK